MTENENQNIKSEKTWSADSVPPESWLNPVKEEAEGDVYKGFFTNLNENDLALLVPLSYRVGLWMSEVDNRGGEEADELEMRMLEAIIVEIGEDFCKSQFIQILMQWTMKNNENWSNWHVGIEKTPEECKKTLWMLEQNGADDKDLNSFRHTLMYIAVSVAMAFREESSDKNELFDELKSKFKNIFGEKQTDYQKDRLKNISKIEKKALTYLSNFVGMDYKEVF